MPVKVIVDLSNASEEEADTYFKAARDEPALEMNNNARKYGVEFVKLVDADTARNYYASQTFEGGRMIDLRNHHSVIGVTRDGMRGPGTDGK